MGKDHRVHSTIDQLPDDLRDALTRMIVDNQWPADFPKHIKGKPRYDDLVEYCKLKGRQVSRSAAARFGMRMRTLTRMKNAGLIVRDVMANLDAEKASATQKAVAEMITAQTIEFIADNENLDAKEILNIARAIKDCTQVSINADKYIREQLTKKVEEANKAITDIARKKKIDPEVLKQIREQVYGIA